MNISFIKQKEKKYDEARLKDYYEHGQKLEKILVIVVRKERFLKPISIREKMLLCPINVRRTWLPSNTSRL